MEQTHQTGLSASCRTGEPCWTGLSYCWRRAWELHAEHKKLNDIGRWAGTTSVTQISPCPSPSGSQPRKLNSEWKLKELFLSNPWEGIKSAEKPCWLGSPGALGLGSLRKWHRGAPRASWAWAGSEHGEGSTVKAHFRIFPWRVEGKKSFEGALRLLKLRLAAKPKNTCDEIIF